MTRATGVQDTVQCSSDYVTRSLLSHPGVRSPTDMGCCMPNEPWLRELCGFPPDTPAPRCDGQCVWLRVQGSNLVDDDISDSGVRPENTVPPSLADRMTLQEWTAFLNDVKSMLKKPKRTSSIAGMLCCLICLIVVFCAVADIANALSDDNPSDNNGINGLPGPTAAYIVMAICALGMIFFARRAELQLNT